MNTQFCKSISCNEPATLNTDFCQQCNEPQLPLNEPTLSERYPQYYKPVGEFTEIDVYATHHLFNLQDPSGCLHHASKKILLSGVRTGGKSAYKDIKEARDTLTRWLELNEEVS
jgi:hypothetical protein